MSLFKVISKTNKGTNRYHNPITACLGGGIDARNVHHNLICMTLNKKIRLTEDKKTRISGLRKSKKRVNGFGTVDNYMDEMYYYLTTFSQQNYTVALLNISNLACLELLTMCIYKIHYT